MTVRVTFRSEIFIEGDTLEEIRDKFETLPFYEIKECNGEDVYNYGFCELVSVEDANGSYEDLMTEWYHAYDSRLYEERR